jgi:hypothetical protein
MDLESTKATDWLEWSFFLKMLSVERSEPFLHELGAPFGREQFPAVMRLARACLETHMAPTVRATKDAPEFYGLSEAWRRYRNAEGVLSDEAIGRFLEQSKGSEVIARSVYHHLQDWIGVDLANSLEKWFVNNFRSGPDPTWQWPWALRLLLADDPQNIKPTTVAPLTEDERQCVISFCIRYGAKKRDLEMRFWVISQAATASLPSLWEAVLQTFPAGGLGNRYPWLGYVEECLQFKLTRKEWTRLNEEIGHTTIDRLIMWVKQQEALLPYDTTLPHEPRLIID